MTINVRIPYIVMLALRQMFQLPITQFRDLCVYMTGFRIPLTPHPLLSLTIKTKTAAAVRRIRDAPSNAHILHASAD
jgi:hypothetical protein